MQEEVGIGDSHLCSASAITARTGIGASAERTNAPACIRVNLGNGATARPNGGDIDHGCAERMSADLAVCGEHWLAGPDEGDIS